MTVNVDKIRLFSVSFLLAVPFFMGMYPFGFPGYSPILAVTLLLTFSQNLKKRETPIVEVYILYAILILMGIIFLYAIFLSTATITSNVQQVKNTIISVLLILLLISNVRRSHEQKMLNSYFKVFLVFCTTFFSLFGLFKLFMVTQGVVFDSILQANGMTYPQGASLLIDYNSFALFADIGFLSVLELMKVERNRYRNILWSFILLVQFISVLLSNSRRGLILLVFILLLYLFVPPLKKAWVFLSAGFHSIKFSKHSLRRLALRLSFGIVIFLLIFGVILSYIPQKSDEHIDKMVQRAFTIVAFFTGQSERLTSQRTMRWSNAFDQFEAGSTKEKLFGIGNDYLLEFQANSTFDHPHNALISALLYGGVFAFLIYLIFYITILLLVFYVMFWKKEYYYPLIVLFTMFYSLTSYYSFFYNISFSVAPFLLLFSWKYPEEEGR